MTQAGVELAMKSPKQTINKLQIHFEAKTRRIKKKTEQHRRTHIES